MDFKEYQQQEEKSAPTITIEAEPPTVEVTSMSSTEQSLTTTPAVQPEIQQFQSTLARLVKALAEEDEQNRGYETPDDYVDLPRHPKTAFFLDKAYEKKIQDQIAAIEKALPQWLAHQIKRPAPTTQAEANRWVDKYRTLFNQMFTSPNENLSPYEAANRERAEDQVRWGNTPDRALKMMLETVLLQEDTKARFIEVLDKSPRIKKKKARK